MKNFGFSTVKIILIMAGVVALIGFIAYLRGNAGMDTFRSSYVTGYEGDFTEFSYTLKYPEDQFMITGKGRKASITEFENGNVHALTFFWNGAAGFASTREFWENQGSCSACTESESVMRLRSAKEVLGFEDEKKEYAIASLGDFFLIAEFMKPADAARDVLATFAFATRPAPIPNEFLEGGDATSTIVERTISFNIFLMNQKLAPVKDCTEVVAVMRMVPATPGVGRAALEMLLQGPTRADLGEGYTSNIPTGSVLNSLKIVDGEARADFNAKIEEGGGSCSMAARMAQITETLKQFPTVKSVKLSVEGRTEDIFQP